MSSGRRGSEYEILEHGHPAKTLKKLVDNLNSGSTDDAMQMFASDALIVYKSGGKIEGGKEEKYEKTTIHDFLTDKLKPKLEVLGSIDAVGARGEGEVKLSTGSHASLVLELGEGGKIDRLEVIPSSA